MIEPGGAPGRRSRCDHFQEVVHRRRPRAGGHRPAGRGARAPGRRRGRVRRGPARADRGVGRPRRTPATWSRWAASTCRSRTGSPTSPPCSASGPGSGCGGAATTPGGWTSCSRRARPTSSTRGGVTTEWSYERDRAETSVDPRIRLPRTADLTPPAVAARLLRDVDADELTRLPARRVAGRDALGLRLVPGAPQSSIDHVDVWADRETGIPLRVEVYGAESGAGVQQRVPRVLRRDAGRLGGRLRGAGRRGPGLRQRPGHRRRGQPVRARSCRPDELAGLTAVRRDRWARSASTDAASPGSSRSRSAGRRPTPLREQLRGTFGMRQEPRGHGRLDRPARRAADRRVRGRRLAGHRHRHRRHPARRGPRPRRRRPRAPGARAVIRTAGADQALPARARGRRARPRRAGGRRLRLPRRQRVRARPRRCGCCSDWCWPPPGRSRCSAGRCRAGRGRCCRRSVRWSRARRRTPTCRAARTWPCSTRWVPRARGPRVPGASTTRWTGSASAAWTGGRCAPTRWGCGSASAWLSRCCASRACWCWTSRPTGWTRRASARCGTSCSS